MKKITIFLIITTAFVAFLTLFFKENKGVTKEEFRTMIDNHPMQERLKLSKSERKKSGIPPNRYFDDQYLLEMNPATGKTNPENIQAIIEEERSSNFLGGSARSPGEDTENAWVDRGPNNIGGRTRVVFYDPNDINGTRVFAGGVSGGLWVNDDISNASSSWTQVGIDENLAITCFAIDPNDSNTWYVGTGEAYTHNDGTGNGAWYTTDGGNTWSVLWSINLNQGRGRRPYFFNEIVAWDNNGTTEVFFSLDGWLDYNHVGFNASGWYKMENGNINQIEFDVDGDTRAYVFSDVEIAADNSLWCATKKNRWSTGGGEIYRTTDGENFTQKYSLTGGDRVELSASKTNPNLVYALVEEGNSTGVRIVKTTDGENFTVLPEPADADTGIDADHFTRGQAFYNLMVEVDPTNDNIVYVGGIDLFRSDNGGFSWNQISKWSNNNNLANLNVSLVHADHHALVFDPSDSNKGIFANDGGVYYSSNLSIASSSETAIVARNNNYNITQFYSGAIGPDPENEMLLGGAQDNGSLYVGNATSGTNSFSEVYSGDGVATFIDKDEEYLIVSYVYNVYESYLLPITANSQSIPIRNDTSRGSFANIADLDDNLDILYVNGSSDGTYRVSRFTDLTSGNVGAGSFANSNFIDSEPTAIKVSPYTTGSTTLFVGSATGSIVKIENADDDSFGSTTLTYTNIDVNGIINTGSISSIELGENEDEILVTLHNYGVNNIYYTSDGGTNWAVKDGDFADIPVKAIMMNPMDDDEVIIGTNYGVWQTDNFTDDNPEWVHSQNGMSSVKVTSFELREADNTVLASTYGRGLFTSTFTADSDLSIDQNELSNNSIIIYPTVSKDGFFNLKTTAENYTTSVEIYDLHGVKVYAVQNLELETSSDKEIKLEASSGLYIMKIYSGNKVLKSQKVIIQ
ncbi:T9SS type A sorting domain-containing protein [Winogradskyella sp. Asnod2-B02-A]|uniref:T9SS type A sorting domain-containing protein n=1 Tax=Winogradskyella sp. Asnod2-B02-A TaxID=3160583 RepID=UPI00386EE213